MRENLAELPAIVELAARIGVDEVYLRGMVFGLGDKALAREDRGIFDGYRTEGEAIIAEAQRRSTSLGARSRGAAALSPREGIVDRAPWAQPWQACSRPLHLAQ